MYNDKGDIKFFSNYRDKSFNILDKTYGIVVCERTVACTDCLVTGGTKGCVNEVLAFKNLFQKYLVREREIHCPWHLWIWRKHVLGLTMRSCERYCRYMR